MALVKCKECGEGVSTKAKACPNCGAKVPKKLSLITWFVLAFIVFVIYSANQTPTKTSKLKSTEASLKSKKSDGVKKVVNLKSSWITSTSKDEMTGKFSAYAHSPSVYPTKKMGFPYRDVKSWIGVGCDAKNEWVYFGFTSAPNLTKDETKDGYNLIHTRIKWNDYVENISLTQDWGSKFIHFSNDSDAIKKIEVSSSLLLELQWHGQQPPYFKYSLLGSSKAISEIRIKCAANK